MATELISGMMETGTLESGNLIKEKDKANSGSKIETIMRGSGKMIKDMVWEQKSGPMEINMWENGYMIKKREKVFSIGKMETVILAPGKTTKFGE
jgi:hypothetical protein